jgi:hypothetical protein
MACLSGSFLPPYFAIHGFESVDAAPSIARVWLPSKWTQLRKLSLSPANVQNACVGERW